MDCYTNNFPGLPSLKNLAADKHVIAELPLVPFVIINLTRLTVGVCMKVRFKSKVTRGFSLSPLRDSRSPLRGSLTWGKIKKNLWDQGIKPLACGSEFLPSIKVISNLRGTTFAQFFFSIKLKLIISTYIKKN